MEQKFCDHYKESYEKEKIAAEYWESWARGTNPYGEKYLTPEEAGLYKKLAKEK